MEYKIPACPTLKFLRSSAGRTLSHSALSLGIESGMNTSVCSSKLLAVGKIRTLFALVLSLVRIPRWGRHLPVFICFTCTFSGVTWILNKDIARIRRREFLFGTRATPSLFDPFAPHFRVTILLPSGIARSLNQSLKALSTFTGQFKARSPQISDSIPLHLFEPQLPMPPPLPLLINLTLN